MKIVLASPLYPPDIAQPAPYIKELAMRLRARHSVALVVYGELPEKVDGVKIVSVSKRLPLIIRLIKFMFALARACADADVIYAENGASIELPLALVRYFTHARVLIHI